MAAGGRGIKVAHTALSVYRIVPWGRVQVHDLGTKAGGPARDRLSNQLCPDCHLGLQPAGRVRRALGSTDRHTALFWNRCGCHPLPPALGTAHVAPEDEIPERKEPLLPTLRGVSPNPSALSTMAQNTAPECPG